MGSWSKGFAAGMVTVLAAVMLISVMVMPSVDTMLSSVHSYGTSIVSSVLPTGGSSTKSSRAPAGAVEFLNADTINDAIGSANNNSSFGSAFDNW